MNRVLTNAEARYRIECPCGRRLEIAGASLPISSAVAFGLDHHAHQVITVERLETPLMALTYKGFQDGQVVTHRTRKDHHGNPLKGTVAVFELTPEERAEGCAEADVTWHDTNDGDELDDVIDDIY